MPFMIVLSIGSIVTYGQSAAPYSSCIKFTDHGYNITLEENSGCNTKQLSETALYFQANGYHEVTNSNITGSQIMLLVR